MVPAVIAAATTPTSPAVPVIEVTNPAPTVTEVRASIAARSEAATAPADTVAVMVLLAFSS